MKLIVGLGNPGSQYERTRHNAGFMALDAFTAKHAPAAIVRQRFSGALTECNIGSEKVLLLKPLRFMNASGTSIAEACNFYKLSPQTDLLVLVDDYALPIGALRIRTEGSAGGHNGLSDTQRALATPAYPRLRIGIDAPPPSYSDPAEWVLGRFTDDDLFKLKPVWLSIIKACETFVADGATAAMNKFNQRGPTNQPPSQPAAAAAPTTLPASTFIPPSGRDSTREGR